MENWRKFLREQDEKNYKGPSLNYSSVVLDDASVDKLLDLANKLKQDGEIPSDFVSKDGQFPHHMTINMGPLLDGWTNDELYNLVVDGWGLVDGQDKKGKPARAMAFRVSKQGMPNIKNDVAHITALVPEDGKPFHSNQIENWSDLSPMEVSGIVVGAEDQQKKAPEQKPKQEQSPKDFAKSLADRGMSADKIRGIMSKKFPNIPEKGLAGILMSAGIK